MNWRELIFCLLEVHSPGLCRSLAHSLGCHAEASLSHPPLSPATVFLSLLLSPSRCMAAASPPADTCPADTGKDVC